MNKGYFVLGSYLRQETQWSLRVVHSGEKKNQGLYYKAQHIEESRSVL